jgi:hypothetical protein
VTDELTNAVPKDDAAPIPDVIKDAAVDDAAEADDAAADAAGTDELDAAALAAVAEDDEAGRRGIPKARFNEVIEDRNALREQNERLLALVEASQKQPAAAAVAQEVEKPRDFEAEFSALQAKFDAGEIEDAEFRTAERKLIREEAKYDAKKEVLPLVEQLTSERNIIASERLARDLNQEAAKAYEKYPFLDHTSEGKNEAAIKAVLAERDELIATGVAPTKALRLAVAAIAPDFATPKDPKTADELAAARRAKARIDAGAAETRQPPPLAGAGNGSRTPGVQRLTASVKDNEKWGKVPEAERDKAFTA